MMTIEEYLCQMNASPEECKEVLDWIRKGNDFLTNGDYLVDEYGHPMDYISASRFMKDICVRFATMTPEELAEELAWQDSDSDNLVDD